MSATDSYKANGIAQYETAEGPVEIHGLRGGYTVFVGERMVQDRLNGREIVCYLAHALQAAHHKLSKRDDGPSSPLHPHVDGRDFYELCQQYRHAKELMPHPSLPNVVQAFHNLQQYIKTGALPWESYERSPATGLRPE